MLQASRTEVAVNDDAKQDPMPDGLDAVGDSDLEALAARLDAHADYRVLRRLERDVRDPEAGPTVRRALYLDVETTGMDASSDAIIELAMLLFGYDAEGRVTGVEEAFDRFEDPGRPIPPEIQKLTGITDADVQGQAFDNAEVERFRASANLVIAHNARFDRSFIDRRFPAFADMPWACSQADVPWRAMGLESAKLEYLVYRMGRFYDGHRAIEDCHAGVFLLAQSAPTGEGTFMQRLLDQARTPAYLVEAVGSPYETKDRLRLRRYKWHNPTKTWWKIVPGEALEEERAWLAAEVYGGRNGARERRIEPKDRFKF